MTQERIKHTVALKRVAHLYLCAHGSVIGSASTAAAGQLQTQLSQLQP